MYYDINTNPFFKPASTMEEQSRFRLIKHFYFMAVKARQEGMPFESYALYALLRGADVRKTSHLEDGANAVDALRRLADVITRHFQRVEKWGKPVMNHALAELIGLSWDKRNQPIGNSITINDHFGEITIDFQGILDVVKEGIAFYEALNESKATSAA